MPRNGSGSYQSPAGQPVTTGTVIDSTVFNTNTSDVATALTNSVAKNGETTPTANLPMGGFKHTGVADATARTQYESAAQAQDGTLTLIASISGTDTITGSPTVAVPAYVAGQAFRFIPANTNTGAATINISGLGAKSIVKSSSGVALVAGDLQATVPATIVYNGTSFFLQTMSTTAFGDGSVAVPSITFALDQDTGIYRRGANLLSFTTGNNLSFEVGTDQAFAANGTATLPGFTFINDPNTGVYRVSADRLGLSVGGVQQVDVTAASLECIAGQILAPAGTVASPGFAFGVDANLGLYRIGVDTLGVSVGNLEAIRFNNAAGVAYAQMANGNVTNPGYSFNGDNNTGWFLNAVGDMRATISGTTRLVSTAAIFQVNSTQIFAPDGAVGTPGYSFANDPDTGFYRVAGNQIQFAEGGTGFRIGFRSVPVSATTTTLVAEDNGKCVPITAAINIPISVFAAGDCVSIYNNSAGALNITISAGTLRLAGTTSTGTRSLVARGMATLWVLTGGATPEVICSGNVT